VINISSRTDEEEECALFVLNTMDRLGFEVSCEKAREKRGNAIVGEPTGCQGSWENKGYAWFKIGVKWYLTCTASKPALINPIPKDTKATDAI
jgi:hypothetical protein